MKQLLLSLVALSSAANVPQLPVKVSYCSSTTYSQPPRPTDPTTYAPPTTRWPTTPWYTTTTPRYSTTTSRPSTSTTAASSSSSTPDPSCPLGWVDDGNLGCFLFAPQMAGLSWIEALEFCEEQVRKASKFVNLYFSGFLFTDKESFGNQNLLKSIFHYFKVFLLHTSHIQKYFVSIRISKCIGRILGRAQDQGAVELPDQLGLR